MTIDSQTTVHHLTHPKYRADIDGLRAIAVLSVVGFHAFPKWIPGGFVGVDIFFIISGFLISGIIFGNLEKNSFSYSEFYARRIKRIFPALLLVLFSSYVFGWYVLLSNEYAQFGKHMAAGASFISNFILWNEAGYFDNMSDLKPLLHLWSLAIEEQFYIVWPLLLGLIWKRKLNFLTLTITIAAISFSFNIFIANTNPTADFYSPFSRFWELMLGGTLAYLTLHKPQHLPKKPNWQAIIGFIFIAAGLLLVNRDRAFPGWWALLPTLGAVLIISAGPNAWFNKNILGNKLVVWVGLISYPLYLWHWPLLSFARIIANGEPSKEIRFTLVLTSFLLAWLTYQFLEKHIRNNTTKFVVPSLSILMLFSLIFGLLTLNQTWGPRNSNPKLEIIVNAIGDWESTQSLQALKMNGQSFYFKEFDNQNVLLLGDSHIEQYIPRVVDYANKSSFVSKSVYFATQGGCPPIPGVYEDSHPDCGAFREEAIKFASNPIIESVAIGAYWNDYFIGQTKKAKDAYNNYEYYFLENGEKKYFRQGEAKKLALLSLEALLKKLSATKKVYLILDNPASKLFDPKTYFEGSRLGGLVSVKEISNRIPFDKEQEELRKELIDLAHRAGSIVIDPVPTLCPNNSCLILTNDGIPLYKDHNHLRPFFVKNSANYIDEIFKH